MDAIVRVGVVTFVKTVAFGLSCLCRLSGWIWVPYTDLLKLCVDALLQNSLRYASNLGWDVCSLSSLNCP